jgi:hypothetical protein
MKNNARPLRPLIVVFIALTGLFIAGRSFLLKHGIDQEVLILGNLILLIASLLSFWAFVRSLRSKNPNAAVRAMYGSFMIKFFLCAIAAFAYILVVKKEVNKPALYICMGLYLVYSFLEVAGLTRLLKEKKNA